MKDGISIRRDGDIIYLEGGRFTVSKYRDEHYDVGNNLLSWENASYMYSEPDEEEADDYLLNHALQDNKKLCVCISTSNSAKIVEHFSKMTEYEIYVEERNNRNDLVFVYRKGSLVDYFDMDYIEDVFEDDGIGIGVLRVSKEKPISAFVTRERVFGGINYNLLMDTEHPECDEVLQTYGPSALIIAGLIFGYPIEIIKKAIWIIFPMGWKGCK